VSNRYDVSDAAEGQFEPGSNNQVLRNLRGIVDPAEMNRLETAWLAEVQRRSAEIDSGAVEIVPAEEAFAKLETKFRK